MSLYDYKIDYDTLNYDTMTVKLYDYEKQRKIKYKTYYTKKGMYINYRGKRTYITEEIGF